MYQGNVQLDWLHLPRGHRHWGNGNVFLICHREFPQNTRVTYCRIVCNIQPQKKDIHMACITMGGGGGKLTYDIPVSTPTVDLPTAKLHWKSVLSTPNLKYLIVDIKNLYPRNPMKRRSVIIFPSSSSPKNHRQIWPHHQTSWWVHIRQGVKYFVWPSSSVNNCTQRTRVKSAPIWVWT